jgi:hypothetical protein
MPHVKTTVYLDGADYRRLKTMAAAQGRSTAELIRIAVSEYTHKTPSRPLPKSLGAFASGDPTFAERAEELLKGFGED